MSNTKIEWTDKTWNPITGCTKVSPGCDNCYAIKIAQRLAGRCGYPANEPFRPGTVHADKMDAPLHWKKPQKIFVCSMGDLFHDEVSFYLVHEVMITICKTPHHVYQILTKRPRRMSDYFSTYRPPSYVWLGVTVCNQAEVDEKIPVLLQIPATVRFVSVEPMLEAIDLRLDWRNDTARWDSVGRELPLRRISWVICGGETGANARPMNPDWARALRDQCKENGVPFFFKQMTKKQPIPDDLLIREFPKGGTQ